MTDRGMVSADPTSRDVQFLVFDQGPTMNSTGMALFLTRAKAAALFDGAATQPTQLFGTVSTGSWAFEIGCE